MPCKFRIGDDRCNLGFSDAELEAGARCVLHSSPDDEASWSDLRTPVVQRALNSVIARCVESNTPVDLAGVVIPRDVSFGNAVLAQLIVRASHFGGGRHFSGTVFSAPVQIDQCTFRSDASFSEAHFKDKFEFRASAKAALDFSKARFDGSANINIATQGGKHVVRFNGIRCKDSFTLKPSGNFAADLELKEATFEGRFHAEGEYSAEIDCSGSCFSGAMSFSGEANRKFTSKGCHFRSGVDLRRAVLCAAADFSGSRFEERARFTCRFVGPAMFEDCAFEKQADFSAPESTEDKSAALNAIGFQGTSFRGAVLFTNRTFGSTTNFSTCEFFQAPEFHGATLHQDTRLPLIHAFKDRESEDAAAAYRTLRQAMESNNARSEEAMFYALEQKTLRRILGRQTRWENMASALYDGLSAYGVNFWRPIAWLLATMLVFGTMYAAWISWPIALSAPFDGERLVCGLTFSLQQVVNPFWVWRTTELPWSTNWPNALKVAATIESLLTTALFALSLLALRWRFKRE
ncbi:pentapeptide repeat-containing protein [Peristeroidobacter agariperforans]|uniref:pentapeptide repeat-containing protein n=1 Tax=Peristeroidobacter agariperforans TaxID=268404 RepID=UPI00101D0A85|nr:pentapeptide repeat-containing protein [Peristeroidobacter agariperforans]